MSQPYKTATLTTQITLEITKFFFSFFQKIKHVDLKKQKKNFWYDFYLNCTTRVSMYWIPYILVGFYTKKTQRCLYGRKTCIYRLLGIFLFNNKKKHQFQIQIGQDRVIFVLVNKRNMKSKMYYRFITFPWEFRTLGELCERVS